MSNQEKHSPEYQALKAKFIEQFKQGKSPYGKDGAFAPLIKEFLEDALKSELEGHLEEENGNNFIGIHAR